MNSLPKPNKLREARVALRGGLSEAETTLAIAYRKMDELIDLIRVDNLQPARAMAIAIRNDLGRVGQRLNDRHAYHVAAPTGDRRRNGTVQSI